MSRRSVEIRRTIGEASSALNKRSLSDRALKKEVDAERRLGIGRPTKADKARGRKKNREEDREEAKWGLEYLGQLSESQLRRSQSHLEEGIATPEEKEHFRRHGDDGQSGEIVVVDFTQNPAQKVTA